MFSKKRQKPIYLFFPCLDHNTHTKWIHIHVDILSEKARRLIPIKEKEMDVVLING